MSRRRAHALLGCAMLATVATLAAGCSTHEALRDRQVIGVGRGRVNVLVADAVRADVVASVARYVEARRVRVVVRSGSSAAVAAAVKHGTVVDLAVVAGGPALDRIRDELAAPPARFRTVAGTTYWAAPVTDVGARLVRFFVKSRAAAG